MRIYYTVYKTTNLVNGKVYVGKHKTTDIHDSYLGSGKLLRLAIEKYGIENFKKEILHVFDNEDDMNRVESQLVETGDHTYNLCPGGNGGWGFINESGIAKFHGKRHSEETKRTLSIKNRGKPGPKGKPSPMRGKTLTVEHRQKIAMSCVGRTPGNKGKPLTEEQKQKISAKLRLAWINRKNKLTNNAGMA